MQVELSELYRVFRPYRLGPDFTGCDHCVDPADTERLASTELCNLTLADLDSYSFNAMTTWGETKHFKHFLPRLFELAATDYDAFLSAEVLFGKLDYGKWLEWPAAERRAIADFLLAFWKSAIRSDMTTDDDDSIDTVLCAIGNACTDMTPFLREWLSLDSPTPVRQLAHFVLLNAHDITEHQRLANSFWNARVGQAQQVLAWLRHPNTYEFLYDNLSRLDYRLSEAVPTLASL